MLILKPLSVDWSVAGAKIPESPKSHTKVTLQSHLSHTSVTQKSQKSPCGDFGVTFEIGRAHV